MLEINKIHLGNNVELLKKLPDNLVDFTITSPPYDNLRKYNGYSFDFEAVAVELYRVTKEGGIVVWIVNDSMLDGSETLNSFRQALYFQSLGFKVHDTMIWEKMSPFTHKNRYIANFEYMFVFSKGKPKTTNLIQDRKNKYGGTKVHGTWRASDGETKKMNGSKSGKVIKEYGTRTNIWDIPSNRGNRTIHPATFPEQLAHDHIVTWSNEGDLVLDCFMGSGTVARVCKTLNRNFIGMEISPEYVELANQLLQG